MTMPPTDNFTGLTLRLSAKMLATVCLAISAAVGGFFTVQTKQSAEIERRLGAIESKLEILVPRRASTQ